MTNSFVYQLDKIDNNIYLVGQINVESINEVQQALNKLEKDFNYTTLNFYLTSDGGLALEGLKLYDILEATRLNVTIYISSSVGSAATYCLFGKHKVVMYQNAILFFHELYHHVEAKHSNAQAALTLTDRLSNKILNIYNSKTQEITKDWLVTDKYLDSDEALKLKIIDEVK